MGHRNQDDKFIKGALTLTLAGLVVKVIGALYRIPLYAILGGEGFGLFQMAYPIYAIMLTVSSAGLNVAISKAVAERWALGRKSDARAAFRISLILMSVIGLVGSVILYLSRDFVAANLARDSRAAVSIAAISPALFLASVLSALRGWFQGIEEMTVPAVSQILEQLGRLVTMLLFARALMPRGSEFAAAGATFGAAAGAGLGVIYSAIAYRSRVDRERFREKREKRRMAAAGVKEKPAPAEPWQRAANAVMRVAIPISLASAVFGLTELVDLSLVPGRLHAIGIPTEEATLLYGQLTGIALSLVNLATVFTGALQMTIVPSVTAAVALRDGASVRRRVNRALTVTLALGIPAALGLYVLGEQIPILLYNQPGVGPILRSAAPAILFLAIQQVSAGVLQGMGRITTPLVNLMIAIVVKAALTYILVGIPGMGVRGAAVATSVYFAVAAILNLIAIMRIQGRMLQPGPVLRLTLAGAGMAAATTLAYAATSSAAGVKLATIGAIGVGVLTYGVLVLALRAIDPADLESIPLLGRIVRRK